MGEGSIICEISNIIAPKRAKYMIVCDKKYTILCDKSNTCVASALTGSPQSVLTEATALIYSKTSCLEI